MDDFLNENEIARQSQETAFRYIYLKYSNRLYFIVRRLVFVHSDANEILHETFLQALGSLSQYNGKLPLFDWLCKIAVGQTMSYVGKRNQTYSFAVASYEEETAEKLSSDELFRGDERQQKLQMHIAAMPVKQRVVFVLKHFDGMDFVEMSRVLEVGSDVLETLFMAATEKVEGEAPCEDCFLVPDGYFDKLESEIADKISIPAEKIRVEILKPYIYLAIFIAALYCIVRLYVHFVS